MCVFKGMYFKSHGIYPHIFNVIGKKPVVPHIKLQRLKKNCFLHMVSVQGKVDSRRFSDLSGAAGQELTRNRCRHSVTGAEDWQVYRRQPVVAVPGFIQRPCTAELSKMLHQHRG